MVKNKYIARSAGIFLLLNFVVLLALLSSLAIRNGWFEHKMKYYVDVDSAMEMHQGAKVELKGLTIGRISDVTMNEDHSIRITLAIRKAYASQVTEGISVIAIRPFLVGERSIELQPDLTSNRPAPEGSRLNYVKTQDPMALIKTSFADNLLKISSLLNNLDGVVKQANKKKQLEKTVENLAVLTQELRGALPYYTQNSSELSKNISGIVKNLNSISDQMNGLMPTLQEMAKTAPDTTKVLNESLNETRILVKALQRNFFIKGHAEDVRKEEEEIRKPASTEK